jgi:DNA-binding NarL/FixJ family response regulator
VASGESRRHPGAGTGAITGLAPDSQRRAKVVVVDDHPQFRAALSDLVRATGRLELVGEADCGREAILLAWARRPDMAVIDYRMPGMDGIETAVKVKAFCQPLFTILVSASHPDEIPREARDAVDAIVSKEALSPRLLDQLWVERTRR